MRPRQDARSPGHAAKGRLARLTHAPHTRAAHTLHGRGHRTATRETARPGVGEEEEVNFIAGKELADGLDGPGVFEDDAGVGSLDAAIAQDAAPAPRLQPLLYTFQICLHVVHFALHLLG